MLRAAILSAFFLAASAVAQDALEEAVQAIENNDFQSAAPLLEKALEEHPENVSVRFNLGFCYAQLNQDEKAIEHYRAALDAQPELHAARSNLGMLLMRQGRPAEAVEHFEQAANARPEDAQAHFFHADALAKSDAAEAAFDAYSQSLALDPSFAPAALGRGQALAALERYGEAAQSYRRAIEIDPSLISMVLELAEIVEQAGKTELALSLYGDHAAAKPGEAAVAERIGLLLLRDERYAEAAEALKPAVAADPTAASRAALAEAYSKSEQLDKAMTEWREAVALAPSDYDLRMRYANALLAGRFFADASRNYLAATEVDASRTEAWNGLAFSLYKAENYIGAHKALQESASRAQPVPASVYLRALIEDTLKMYKEAKVSYEAFLAAKSGMEDEEWKAEQRLKLIRRVLRNR